MNNRNPLTRREEVWLRAYCAAIGVPEVVHGVAVLCADKALEAFDERFAHAPRTIREAITGVLEDTPPEPSRPRRGIDLG